MDTELYGLSYAFSYMRRCIYICVSFLKSLDYWLCRVWKQFFHRMSITSACGYFFASKRNVSLV